MNPTLSIVIPTLNEEAMIRDTIIQVIKRAANPGKLEIILVDAGSTDKTISSIQDLNIKTFVKPAFKLKKFESLNFGLKEATADMVLFLDADTQLPKHFDQLIQEKMQNSRYVAGAFNMKFDKAGGHLFLLSLINRVRYTLWRTYYGDQAIYCRKDVALEVGGFPDTLMEAAFFCRAMKKKGKLALIKKSVISSSRRFYGQGVLKVAWFDIRMWVRFVLGMDLKRKNDAYWQVNLDNG